MVSGRLPLSYLLFWPLPVIGLSPVTRLMVGG